MRSNVVGIICGARGTGKTDFLKGEVIVPSTLPKKLIIDTFDSATWHNMKTFQNPEYANIPVQTMALESFPGWIEGLHRMYGSDTDQMIAAIQEHARNCLLIFEDSTKYIGKTLTNAMKRFILDSKQKNLDVFFVFHSLAQVPPDLVRMADLLTLFKTNEGEPSKTKYPFPQIPEMMRKVRESKDHFIHISTRLN